MKNQTAEPTGNHDEKKTCFPIARRLNTDARQYSMFKKWVRLLSQVTLTHKDWFPGFHRV